MYVWVGYLGKNHDAFGFKMSSFMDAMDAGLFVPNNPNIQLGGVSILLVWVDPANLLREWLTKPYGEQLVHRKLNFDRTLSQARCVVECDFDRLKAHWRCLSSRLRVAEDNVVSVIWAWVILHNICEDRGNGIPWEPREPLPWHPLVISFNNETTHEVDKWQFRAGTKVWDAIADYLFLSASERLFN